MSVKLQAILDAPIIELDTIDSTNNYAMRLIDADTAQSGLTLVARHQTQGKGQRGKAWMEAGGESLLMSMIVCPEHSLEHQFLFNAVVTTAIADTLQTFCENAQLHIKWPNDIIIGDKKAGGILIENVIRGSNWSYAVIGLGLNVRQAEFPADLPFATSLYNVTGKMMDVEQLGYLLRRKVFEALSEAKTSHAIMNGYNDLLYKKGQGQAFTNADDEWTAQVCSVQPNGQLMVQTEDGAIAYYTHGVVNWKW